MKGSRMDTLQIINMCITILTGSFTVLTLICRPFRNWLLDVKKKEKKKDEEDENRKETDRCLLRDRITSVYFKHCRDCEIRQYEYENVERLYKQYKKLGGNSFIDKIWNEMQDWHIER
jgi:hypothetical protein